MDIVLDYVFYFFLYSMCGWILETVCCSIYYKKLINRGFMSGPFVPIYGSGAVVLCGLLMPFYNKFGYTWYMIPVVILLGVFFANVLEYITSLVMEKLFHARWWDYSNEKFNLHGRICLKHSVYWALATGVIIYVVHPFVTKHMERLVSDELRNIMIVFIGIIFGIDYIITFINAKNKKMRNIVSSDNRIIEDGETPEKENELKN